MGAFFNDSIQVSGIANCYPDNAKTFKQFQVQMSLEIPTEKPDIEHILQDNINVEICNSHVIQTPCSKSYEGQILTGNKLIVTGKIQQKIEYVADNCTQSVHGAEFSIDFSTFIGLEYNTYQSSTYKVIPYVEDVFIKQLDGRRLFKNVMLLLVAVPLDIEMCSSHYDESSYSCDIAQHFDDRHRCNEMPSHKRYFSQFCCEETMIVPCQKPDIEQIVSIIVDPEVISVKFINTMKGTSVEGQHLSGKKAVIEIKFKQKALYVADCPDQSIHGTENVFYKSAYIVLPSLIEGTDPELLYKNNMLKIKLTIEDIYSAILDKRRIFKNICVLAEFQLAPTFELCYSSYHNCTKSELFICHDNGDFNTQITKSKYSKNIKPCWSPNGGQIAYLSGTQEGYTLFGFNIKNGSHNMLIPHGTFENISSFSWLKNSQQIIFSAVKNESKDLYLLSIASNKYQRFTQGAGLIKSYYPKVSPDGCHVAYLRSSSCNADLWYSDIQGKNPHRISSTGAVRDYDWLSDSDGFVYIDNKNECCCEIYMIRLKDHHPTCIVKNDSMYGFKSLAVSPDGCCIAFIGTNKCGDDIYVYDVIKEKLHNITNHHNSIKINSIVWKIDSSKIYYDAKEFMHYDICCVDVSTQYKERITNTDSSYMQLSYRPRIK